MEILERDLEEYLMRTKCEFWFKAIGEDKEIYTFKNQVNIEPYGIIDIVAARVRDDTRILHVWELKRGWIKDSYVNQLYRYVLGLANNPIQNENKLIIVPHLFCKFTGGGSDIATNISNCLMFHDIVLDNGVKIKSILFHQFLFSIDKGIDFNPNFLMQRERSRHTLDMNLDVNTMEFLFGIKEDAQNG